MFFVLASLIGCQQTDVSGTLVAQFRDGRKMFKKRLDSISIVYKQKVLLTIVQGKLSCDLLLYPPARALTTANENGASVGTGELSCNDGRKMDLTWVKVSDRSGFGYGSNKGGSAFSFGFDRDPDVAMDLLDNAKVAIKKLGGE